MSGVDVGGRAVTLTIADEQMQTVYASAARTATPTTYEGQKPAWARGMHLVIDATAVTATPAITFTIQGYSPLGDDAYTILQSTVIATAVTTVMRVYPGLAAVNNLAISDSIPARWRLSAAHGDADSITYSVQVLWLV